MATVPSDNRTSSGIPVTAVRTVMVPSPLSTTVRSLTAPVKRDVIEGLDALGSLLAATELDYEQNDCRSGRELSAVAGRIVERLG